MPPDSIVIASLAFISSIAGMVAGLVIGRRLPESHLTGDSKEVIKQGIGLIATMVALVLGLLVASAKSAFDSEAEGFARLSTDAILLDHALADYGPEAASIRYALRGVLQTTLEALWPAGGRPAGGVDSREISERSEAFTRAVRELDPKTAVQRTIQKRAMTLGSDLARTRWSLCQPSPPLLPMPFLVVLVFWLAALFAGFALLTPGHATVVVTLTVCAVSLAAAVFLIVDLGQPTEGLIQIDDSTLRYAMTQLADGGSHGSRVVDDLREARLGR